MVLHYRSCLTYICREVFCYSYNKWIVPKIKTNYTKYLEEVANGQEILIGKHGKIIAKIIPLHEAGQSRTPGALKGKVWTGDDFDAPMTSLWETANSK